LFGFEFQPNAVNLMQELFIAIKVQDYILSLWHPKDRQQCSWRIWLESVGENGWLAFALL